MGEATISGDCHRALFTVEVRLLRIHWRDFTLAAWATEAVFSLSLDNTGSPRMEGYLTTTIFPLKMRSCQCECEWLPYHPHAG
jgi:hypothetical protein